ncbi:hypothetical protein ACIBQX_47125 [Nonomuraea sp. NPDC049714]
MELRLVVTRKRFSAPRGGCRDVGASVAVLAHLTALAEQITGVIPAVR